MIRKISLIAVLCGFIAGCSSLKIAYGFAETVVRDRIEEYLDIDEQNVPALKREIAALIAWHRIEMLPKYAAFFENQALRSESSGWTRKDSDTAVAEFRGLIRETSIGAAPFIVRILASQTSDAKVKHLEMQIAEKVAEQREDYDQPLADQLEDSVGKTVSSYERFFGPLTEDQVVIVREHKTRTYDPTGGWLDWREKRLHDLARFLRTEPGVDEIQNYIEVALVTPEKIVGQAYRVRADKWWDAQASLIHDLLATLDRTQRQTFADNLRGYAQDMSELADAS